MPTTATFRYGAWEVSCKARAMANGKFRPEVIVTGRAWPSRPRSIAVENTDFSVEYDAVEAGRLQGLAWIENYG